MSITTKQHRIDRRKNHLGRALYTGVQHVNNVSTRYGISKFADEQFLELLVVLNHYPVQLPQIKALIRHNRVAGPQMLHFAQILSPTATLWLISQNRDCNQQDRLGRTPLHEAIRYNNPWLTELLISQSANPTIKDRQGLCSVAEAAFHGHFNLLERLLNLVNSSSSFRKQAQFSENLPLAVATRNGHLNCMQLLLKNRAGQINGYTSKGNTPLIIAIMAGHYEITEWLLENGADPNLANFQGETARDIAESLGTASNRFTQLLYQY